MRTLMGASKEQRISARYIPKGSAKVALKDGTAVVYLYAAKDKLFAIGYQGTASKSSFHYAYRSEENRRNAVNQFFANVQATSKRRSDAAKARNNEPCTLTVGTILHTSWGYDQTNVDFYVVTRIVGKRTVYVRPIAGDYESTGYLCGRTWPAMPIQFTGEETKHIARGSYLTINGHSASPTDGRDLHTSSYA